MQILTLNFLISNFGGIWRPSKWSSNVAKLLYNIFTFVVISSEYFVMLVQFMDIVLIIDNIDDFAANSLMFLTIVAVCCKATIVVVRRNVIINLIQVLTRAPYKPRDEAKITIQTKFDKFIRSCSLKYLIMATSGIIGLTIESVINIMQGRLPYRIWLPFNYNVPMMFWILSIHQLITIIFAGVISIGTDTLIVGFFLQTCAQLEIFENRLHKLIINKTIKNLGHVLPSSNKNKTGISECICQHLSIYKYAKMVNVTFNQVFFVQFFDSMLVICTSVYYLSMHMTELSAIGTLLIYTIALFVQIYIYCWSGNEVMLKSTSIGDTVYHTEWLLLPINEKKELLIVMMRSTIPIKFTSSFLITLSLQSYTNILKASYSAFYFKNKI